MSVTTEPSTKIAEIDAKGKPGPFAFLVPGKARCPLRETPPPIATGELFYYKRSATQPIPISSSLARVGMPVSAFQPIMW